MRWFSKSRRSRRTFSVSERTCPNCRRLRLDARVDFTNAMRGEIVIVTPFNQTIRLDSRVRTVPVPKPRTVVEHATVRALKWRPRTLVPNRRPRGRGPAAPSASRDGGAFTCFQSYACYRPSMIKDRNNQPLTHPGVAPDPFQDRRAVLHQLPARERLSEINTDLQALAQNPTAAVTFHRKKLLRMHDAARLEAGLTSPAQLQRENSPVARMDFSQAQIVWKPRAHVSA
jgi:hypothetical protein